MKNIIPISIIFFYLGIACTQPIFLKNMVRSDEGHFMYGKNPQRSFYENISIGGVSHIWTSDLYGGFANTSAAIYNNVIFIGDLAGRLFAVDRLNGNVLGFKKFSGAFETAPVINFFRIYFVVNNSRENYSTFYVFDFINGKILSETNLFGSVKNEMIKLDDGIIIQTDKNEIMKMNYAGSVIWSRKFQIALTCSPASNGNIIITGNRNGELIFVDEKTGELESTIKNNRSITGGITIDSGNVYFSDEAGEIYALEINTSKKIWNTSIGVKILNTPAVDKNNLYAGNLNGDLFSIDKTNGKINWRLSTGGVLNTAPLVTNDLLIQPDLNKRVFIVDVKTGIVSDTLEFDRRVKLAPLLFDSLIYFGSERGKLHAYKIKGID